MKQRTYRIPDIREAEASFQEMDRSFQYWCDHFDELLAQYPEQIVAIKDGKVVGANADLLELDRTLRAQGIKPPIFARFVTAHPERFMH